MELVGLALHTGVEPFSSKILWIHVWHSNRNPQLILTYYLDVVDNLGFIPLVTQSDPGSENFGIANAQTMLHQWHDPALEGTLQHQWMCSRKNIKPEIMWSQLCHHFTPGFESLLDNGVHQGCVLPTFMNPEHKLIFVLLFSMIFQWIFIPWLQEELDSYCDHVNHTAKWHDHNKILPHRVAELIFDSPQDYGKFSLSQFISANLTDPTAHVCELYVDANHPVFDLVPHALNAHLEECYNILGHPAITHFTIWDVYP
ncbi:hypothetical protein F5J12DRAFT_725221 [Pisolithus orientalis]|uniref:uncharacterized protein n=1 Tax=Pisolithus orientalis TaxID=936130 RepID=UPI002224F44D|nr:uncharacterized protein F5J12DRAFT_725221 [Pisolithus orientalis]KAI5997616.1 hypothetical protein F5J12DRAFT_725221 [Pisolithus orientalis]